MASTPQILNPLESAKAYVALLGSVAAALLGVFAADTVVGQVLTVIVVVSTAVATFAIPNAQPVYRDESEFGDDAYVDGHDTV